jgi:hypothetical protein
MRIGFFIILITLNAICFAEDADVAEKFLVKVSDPYIEMHTGPGRGYPIFYVVGRGDWVELQFRHADWYKVLTDDGKEGWVDAASLSMTLNPSGARVDIRDPNEEDFVVRDWEYGAVIGQLEGLAVMSFYGGYHFTENISNEIILSQASNSTSSKLLFSPLNLIHEPFPEWHVSPFFTLGTGWIQTRPKSTLAGTADRTDQYADYGFGFRMHLTKRFLLRVERKEYTVFTSRNDNEDLSEWKVGFGFFF